jgi:arginine-tRNA-protein transferase
MREDRHSIRLFRTAEHACGYWPLRMARDIVLDPVDPSLPQVYAHALAMGFRRSGGHVYRPQCAACRDCQAVRVPVARFRPNRSQRRCLRDNAALRVELAPARRTGENYALWCRYLDSRHRDGGMDDTSEQAFDQFLRCDWSPTRFLEIRDDGRLLAVAATDVAADALSAVYTFYDPAHSARGLGSYAILSQIQLARDLGLRWLYLGFWLDGHPKMDYKRRYRPLEVFDGQSWSESATLGDPD